MYRIVIHRIARSPEEELDRERIIQVLGVLSGEGGVERSASSPHGEPRAGEWPPRTMLGAEDEKLVAELRAGLARLVDSSDGTTEVAGAVDRTLDRAEFVVRCQLLSGRAARIPQLLPSFVYLMLSPRLGMPEAMSVAKRSARLLQQH